MLGLVIFMLITNIFCLIGLVIVRYRNFFSLSELFTEYVKTFRRRVDINLNFDYELVEVIKFIIGNINISIPIISLLARLLGDKPMLRVDGIDFSLIILVIAGINFLLSDGLVLMKSSDDSKNGKLTKFIAEKIVYNYLTDFYQNDVAKFISVSYIYGRDNPDSLKFPNTALNVAVNYLHFVSNDYNNYYTRNNNIAALRKINSLTNNNSDYLRIMSITTDLLQDNKALQYIDKQDATLDIVLNDKLLNMLGTIITQLEESFIDLTDR